MEMNQKKHQQYVDQQLLEMSQLTKLVTTDEKLHSAPWMSHGRSVSEVEVQGELPSRSELWV